MEAGDLIFTMGTYYDASRKKQRHGMTHVEIFIGGDTGEATIGSRKNEMMTQAEDGVAEVAGGSVIDIPAGIRRGIATKIGHVSVHPSYRFKSLGYSSDKYYFCSIKPWLAGACRPRLTDWVGQCSVTKEWIKEGVNGREATTAARSVFLSDACDDGCGE